MKKNIISSIIFIILGFYIGNFIFSNRIYLLNKSNKNNYYVIQEGIYQDKNVLETNIKNIEQKIVEHKNNNYYVYVGITKNLDNAEKIKKIYLDKGIKVIIKEIEIKNEVFLNNLEQLDILLDQTNDKEEILTIEKVILSEYEEFVKNKY